MLGHFKVSSKTSALVCFLHSVFKTIHKEKLHNRRTIWKHSVFDSAVYYVFKRGVLMWTAAKSCGCSMKKYEVQMQQGWNSFKPDFPPALETDWTLKETNVFHQPWLVESYTAVDTVGFIPQMFHSDANN